MSYIDGEPKIATDADLKRHWNGGKPGECFRCAMCGHRFTVGEIWRFVYANGTPKTGGNFLVCIACDGPDILDRWIKKTAEARESFWFFTRQMA